MYQWFACFSWCILTKHRYNLPNTHTTTSKDIVFRADFSCIFFQFFLLIPPKCDTCDSKKNNIAVGMRAPMRIYACTRETLPENSPSIFFLIFSSSFFSSPSPSSLPPSLSLLLFCASITCKSVFCYMRIADLLLRKGKNALFLDFFTLWGNIDPYTNRGMRCTPPICSETNDLHWILNSCDFLGRLTKKSYLCGSRGMSIYISRCWRKKGQSCRPPQPFSLLPLLFSKGRLAIPTYRHARYHHLRPCP